MTSLQRVRKLLDKYADLPMDFADVTLVALAEELDCMADPESRGRFAPCRECLAVRPVARALAAGC
jgi:hypothetical protein